MGALSNLLNGVRAKAQAKQAAAAAASGKSDVTPLDLATTPTVPSSVTNRLADLYSATFGSSASDSTPIVAVPVNPQPSGGGGSSLGKVVLVLAVLGGGYYLYKKHKAAA